MNLYIQTKLARRRMRRKNGRGCPVWLPVVFFILLGLAMLLQFLRPKLVEYAVNAVQYQATMLMERSVAACTEDMGEVGNLQTKQDGMVTSVATDSVAVNQLRASVVQRIYTDINKLETAHHTVSIGTLLDPQYLAGVGPKLPFGVTALGCVNAKMKTNFSAEGINQTLYTLTICVTADFSIQTLGRAKNVMVSAEYPLQQTIIVGEVPLVASNS